MNHTDDRSLPTDLRDLQILLRRSFPDIPAVPLYVECHYGARQHEIAFVVVGLPDQALRRQVRALAETGLRLLGYEIKNRGRDAHDVWPDPREVSAHDIVRAMTRFARMESGEREVRRRARRHPGQPRQSEGRRTGVADRAPANRPVPAPTLVGVIRKGAHCNSLSRDRCFIIG